MKRYLASLLILLSLSVYCHSQNKVTIQLKDYQGQEAFNSVILNCVTSEVTVIATQKGYEKITIPSYCLAGKSLPEDFIKDLLVFAKKMKKKKQTVSLSGQKVRITRKNKDYVFEFSI